MNKYPQKQILSYIFHVPTDSAGLQFLMYHPQRSNKNNSKSRRQRGTIVTENLPNNERYIFYILFKFYVHTFFLTLYLSHKYTTELRTLLRCDVRCENTQEQRKRASKIDSGSTSNLNMLYQLSGNWIIIRVCTSLTEF